MLAIVTDTQTDIQTDRNGQAHSYRRNLADLPKREVMRARRHYMEESRSTQPISKRDKPEVDQETQMMISEIKESKPSGPPADLFNNLRTSILETVTHISCEEISCKSEGMIPLPTSKTDPK